MNKEEKACVDMADVCELAHKRTVKECASLGIPVDCTGADDCDELHDDEDEVHYTRNAQTIFDKHYDDIIEKTGL